ncbi:hypothetical protein AVEN_118378-1 [Araneus ventricosus]|uniref:Uncharacterized protein n=1 Tax=Araneus ventricosus TaxID=182803 RepID=A0A4Y2B506_ARAVE|nr:hypothetical protein AVEN_118378-1 [Araneus ventricosus]
MSDEKRSTEIKELMASPREGCKKEVEDGVAMATIPQLQLSSRNDTQWLTLTQWYLNVRLIGLLFHFTTPRRFFHILVGSQKRRKFTVKSTERETAPVAQSIVDQNPRGERRHKVLRMRKEDSQMEVEQKLV